MIEKILENEGPVGFLQEFEVVGYLLYSFGIHCKKSEVTHSSNHVDASCIVYKKFTSHAYPGCGDICCFLMKLIKSCSILFDEKGTSTVYEIDTIDKPVEIISTNEYCVRYNKDCRNLWSNCTPFNDDIFVHYALQIGCIHMDGYPPDLVLSPVSSSDVSSAIRLVLHTISSRYDPKEGEITYQGSPSYNAFQKPQPGFRNQVYHRNMWY